MSDIILFWKPGPAVKLSAPEISRELTWGEEVHGLIDLPVKAIIDLLKATFADHEERAGSLVCRGGVGSFEATWTWQHLKVECHNLPPGDRERLIDVLAEFDCEPHEPAPR